MPVATINWIEPDNIDHRLRALGFPREVLEAAIHVWMAARNSGTPFHASNYEGTVAFHEGIATLRQEGHQHGLVKDVQNGVELCLCPSTGVAVMLALGGRWTGDADNLERKPTTKYKRGPGSQELLTKQLTMFPVVNGQVKKNDYSVWIFMLRMSGNGTVAAELSLPAVVANATSRKTGKQKKTGVITDWYERVFLGTFSAGPRDKRSQVEDDLVPTAEIDVPVRPRR